MFGLEKHCLVKHFAFLKNFFYWYVNFVLWVIYCFFNEPLIGGDKFFKQGPAYKKGPDPNKGSKQQEVKILNKRSKADFTVGNIYFFTDVLEGMAFFLQGVTDIQRTAAGNRAYWLALNQLSRDVLSFLQYGWPSLSK